nr:MAG TPA: hypothetical protein [Caudoviricetes sp.]
MPSPIVSGKFRRLSVQLRAAESHGSFPALFRMRGSKPRHFSSKTQKFWVVSGHIKTQ